MALTKPSSGNFDLHPSTAEDTRSLEDMFKSPEGKEFRKRIGTHTKNVRSKLRQQRRLEAKDYKKHAGM